MVPLKSLARTRPHLTVFPSSPPPHEIATCPGKDRVGKRWEGTRALNSNSTMTPRSTYGMSRTQEQRQRKKRGGENCIDFAPQAQYQYFDFDLKLSVREVVKRRPLLVMPLCKEAPASNPIPESHASIEITDRAKKIRQYRPMGISCNVCSAVVLLFLSTNQAFLPNHSTFSPYSALPALFGLSYSCSSNIPSSSASRSGLGRSSSSGLLESSMRLISGLRPPVGLGLSGPLV